MTDSLAALLRDVRALEVAARKNVSALLAGNYLTSIPGRGLDFHEARPYVQGEPIRQIDWKITARMGTPYVKTYLEERQRELFIALDVSPSMYSGWQVQTKIEAAVELAATLALSAVAAGDRVGLLTFADCVEQRIAPSGGRKHLYRLLQSLISARSDQPARKAELSDPRAAIHEIQRMRRRRFVVFIISDFIDHDVPDDIRFVQRRHDVSLLHVYDPVEYAADVPVVVPAVAAEGMRRPTLIRPGETGSLEEMLHFLRAEAARRNVDFGSLSTREPIGGWLTGFFHAKQRRIR